MSQSGRASHHRWLKALTDLPTAPGKETAVTEWVRTWAEKRGLAVRADAAGNLLVGPPRRSRRRPVVAVAHMDHPALVIEKTGPPLAGRLRGGVYPEYLAGAAVQIESEGGPVRGRVVEFDQTNQLAFLAARAADVKIGDVARWYFAPATLGVKGDRLASRACDDLAGAAAALSALDLAVGKGITHFLVLLTRAEEVGFVGAIAACELRTIPVGARVLSIECSRASDDAPVGGGPIVRVGDASSVFSHELTNQVTEVVKQSSLLYQRKLMAGGSCEATAFAVLGYEATGLCLALDNYHNMANIDLVRAGKRKARLAPEEISLADFDGLVALLMAVTDGLDSAGRVSAGRVSAGRVSAGPTLQSRLRHLYQTEKHVLD